MRLFQVITQESLDDTHDPADALEVAQSTLVDLETISEYTKDSDDFDTEEKKQLTEFLQTKQELVGLDKTEFTQDNLEASIESLKEAIRIVSTNLSPLSIEAYRDNISYSEEAFGFGDKFKKNIAGFFAAFSIFGDKAVKIKDKATRILAMIEKEDGDSDKKIITGNSVQKLSFLKDAPIGLEFAEEYMSFFSSWSSSRVKLYSSVDSSMKMWLKWLKDRRELSRKQDEEEKIKAIKNTVDVEWITPVKGKITSIGFTSDEMFFALFGYSNTYLINEYTKYRHVTELIAVNRQSGTRGVVKPNHFKPRNNLPVVKKDELIKYLKNTIDFCDKFTRFYNSIKPTINSINKVASDAFNTPDGHSSEVFSLCRRAYSFIKKDATIPLSIVLSQIEAGVDFCYDHYS